MNKVLMIADDLTGANANCSLMKKIGLRAMSFLGNEISEIDSNIDVVAVTTDSRSMNEKSAKNAVISKLKIFEHMNFSLYSKRIDSTLRGNIGAELTAFQDFFNTKKLAICVPVYPSSGRIVINDTMYVNGKLLLNTDAGKDPKMPVKSSKVSENFKNTYHKNIKNIYIDDIEKGKDNISKLLKEYEKNTDLVIFDGISDEHISTIAEAVLDSKIDFIATDPGPFTKELTSLIYKSSSIATKALAVVGSVTELTISQLEELEKAYKSYRIDVNPLKLLSIDTIFDEIDRCLKEVKDNIELNTLIILTTTPRNFLDRLNLKEISIKKGISVDDLSLLISRSLANIAKQVLIQNSSISGVFSSGGDISVAVAEELLSLGIEIKEEVIPLCAYGRLNGGLIPGLKIVSKGGMVGSKETMVLCIEKILKLEAEND